MNTFYVGQKVVCVYTGDFPDMIEAITQRLVCNTLDGLEEGKIYTIREVYLYRHPASVHPYPDVNIRVVEIVRGPEDMGFRADRFRPLQEKKYDISIFQKMCLPENIKALKEKA